MSASNPRDLSKLPTYAFGGRMTATWGTAGFIVVEGTAFALAAACYLYLAVVNPAWPIGTGPPSLLWSTLVLLSLLVSVWPNWITKKNARNENLAAVRRDLIIMSVMGIIPLILRVFEFRALDVTWEQNAYGSIVWVILGLHTVHLITDVGDTIVLAVLMHTRHGKGRRFTDVEDNAVYWDFVVISWIAIYALIYLFPRWWAP